MDDNIVKFEQRAPVIKRVRQYQGCQHKSFIVDSRLNIVKCGDCGAELSPMWALTELAARESRYRNHIEQLKAQAEKTEAKLRCKCQHCGNMTRIIR
ncbi:hypothetical protein BTO19_09515 [Vibrio parahaemolyticus]|nr:hypothetical protein BTO19_09515 [Vibrio parahaemolyticus]TBT62637.1 hypothetical protein D5E77_15305 [Vibrio parahaemolyticus]TOE36034.1 hypothetical protein CGJ43_24765 [Vibrio parahaemolyticus]TOQ35446.1 hypothetical protein CGG96_25150 [Vibrio parahaemolyticus]TOQ57120.1 hypothetical protein CGG92_21050 [Vibrio parahaemolyticus]